ncbi:LOW QUALITY PROTEIN: uncharacterized protein [Leuresthes tenuis]|uniref:LOW QUALITY PROTEIN: uncharacterized protein n=1 Tax=Leuresthes tenuis TaxID=355514 RepID=UPI003B50DA4F
MSLSCERELVQMVKNNEGTNRPDQRHVWKIKGHKIVLNGRKQPSCVACGDGYYQPTENVSQSCKGCTTCQEGSFEIERCTKVADAKCQCHEGFVPYMEDSVMCKCDRGFELRQGVCSECDAGYFNPSIGKTCKKWKEYDHCFNTLPLLYIKHCSLSYIYRDKPLIYLCILSSCKETGVKIPGTPTTDAICNEAMRSYPPAVSTPNKSFSLAETHPPHEGAETQTTHSTTTTLFRKTSVTEKVRPPPYSNTGNHFGMAPFIFGFAVLLVLTAVICKLYFSPCWQKIPTQHTNDPLCRRPVEESGDSSESSLKLNPEP